MGFDRHGNHMIYDDQEIKGYRVNVYTEENGYETYIDVDVDDDIDIAIQEDLGLVDYTYKIVEVDYKR